MGLERGDQTLMLASVVSGNEALASVTAGVDIIDCKDPGAGALGALSRQEIQNIVRMVHGRVPVSATIGDIPCAGQDAETAIMATAQTGVDFVKVGLFEDTCSTGCGAEGLRFAVEKFGRLELGRARLVAVLLADKGFDLSIVDVLARAGFAGVMLDTADKLAGRLSDVLSDAELDAFVSRAKACGMFAGLAGRLRLADIAAMLSLKPDIVGFRGALCLDGARGASLDVGALKAVRGAIPIAQGGIARVIGHGEIDTDVRNAPIAAFN